MDRRNKIESRTIHNLKNADIDTLSRRYIQKKSGRTKELNLAVADSLNRKKDDGYFNYGILHLVCEKSQDSLNYIYEQIFSEISAVLDDNGYQLRIDNILEDFNNILNEHVVTLLEIKKDKSSDKFLPFIQNLVDIYVEDVVNKVLSRVLGNRISDIL